MFTDNRKTLRSEDFDSKHQHMILKIQTIFSHFPKWKAWKAFSWLLTLIVVRRQSCPSCRLHSKHCTPWSREINKRWASHAKGQTPWLGKSHLHSPHPCRSTWTYTADLTPVWYRKVFILAYIWPRNITKGRWFCKKHHTTAGPQYAVQKLCSAVRALFCQSRDLLIPFWGLYFKRVF